MAVCVGAVKLAEGELFVVEVAVRAVSLLCLDGLGHVCGLGGVGKVAGDGGGVEAAAGVC